MTGRHEVTRLLLEWQQGNQAAVDRLVPILYQELRRLAAGYSRDERAATTLESTVLVQKAYVYLIFQDLPDWQRDSHFFSFAVHLIRQILIDHARRRKSAKTGGEVIGVSLDDDFAIRTQRSPYLVALDDALNKLANNDLRQSRIIERFFGALSVEECEEAMNLSTATLSREQRLLEAYLHRQMRRGATA